MVCEFNNIFKYGCHTVAVGVCLLAWLEKSIVSKQFPWIYNPVETFPQITKGYGLVLLVNVVFTSYVLAFLSHKVSNARTNFTEKAQKDGEENASERYAYPKLYAEGYTENAKKFNSIQRGHQHALETYTKFLVFSLLGGIQHPVLVVIAGVLWCFGTIHFAKVYAKDCSVSSDSGKSALAAQWLSLMIVNITTLLMSLHIVGLSAVKRKFTEITGIELPH